MRNNPKLRWFPYAGGFILLGMGAALILWPEMVVTVFPPLMGTIMIFLGGVSLASLLFLKGSLRDPGLKLVQGFVQIIVGVVFIAKGDISLAFMAILFGLYALVSSGISLSDSLQLYREDRRACIIGSVESVFGFLVGGFIMFAPFSHRNIWSQVLGLYFLGAALHSFYWTHKITRLRPPEPDEADGDENSGEGA